MKSKDDLHNQLKAVRQRLKLSQQELADAAGVARQTISGIEAGLYAASASVALRLARALDCRVEDLFWLEGDAPPIAARLVSPTPAAENVRVSLAHIDGGWVAQPLVGDKAFRSEMIPADGVATIEGETATVRLLDDSEVLQRTVAVAGCDPSLSLWVRSAERWNPGLRIHWTHANSTVALERLRDREIHIAGIHFHHPDNEASVRRLLPGKAVVLVNLGIWEEGFVVRAGNPKNLMTAADLGRRDVTIVNREAGAGSRLLLDHLLEEAKLTPAAIGGYDQEAHSHLEVARSLLAGTADIGMGTAAVAAAYGLSFVSLHSVRYDLAIFKDDYKRSAVQQLLDTLNHRWVRSQLQVLGGYDTSHTGEVVAEIE